MAPERRVRAPRQSATLAVTMWTRLSLGEPQLDGIDYQLIFQPGARKSPNFLANNVFSAQSVYSIMGQIDLVTAARIAAGIKNLQGHGKTSSTGAGNLSPAPRPVMRPQAQLYL